MSQKKNILNRQQKFQRRIEVVRVALKSGPQQAVIKFGIPARTVGSWVKRFKEGKMDALKDKSRAPHYVANKKDKDGVLSKALRDLHDKEPGLNRLQIFSKLLIEATGEPPTMAWIAREKRRLGLTKKRKIRVNQHKTRYEIYTPGALQIDTKVVDKQGEPGEKIYQFTAIDECSRVRFLGGSLTKGAKAATHFLKQAISFYASLGVRVYQVQTDNGTEFTLPHTETTLAAYARGDAEDSLFTKYCNENNIKHRLIKPRTPQLNGKVERSHRIDSERFYSRYEFSDDHALDDALKNVWMYEYNELRPHGTLGGLTPMAFLKKRLTEFRTPLLVADFLNKQTKSTEHKIAA